ncbi:Tetratricopeptide-like helical domain containing protein [Parasponia andersonii]|uniref:Tetratricopeptide-like helical domain containing protein n=1 Tax=Parasponia andersonii TaxID=3476 RepID=A0A2P5BMX3_PARAD|nr:Tetratricopeptide-like helical domain containing protein [Parasponia andersonii]
MVVKSSLLGTWNHLKLRKANLGVFSSFSQASSLRRDDVVLTNVSITGHCRNGQLDVARDLFDGMRSRTTVSWNTMISGYSKWGKYDEALSMVSMMQRSNTRLNETTFSRVFSVCGRSGSMDEGKEVHCLVLKSGMESFELVGSALLFFYANCNQIEDAKRIFDELRGVNELLWSVMLVGYVQCNLLSDAWDVFVKMPKREVVAWTTLISGYAKIEDGCERALELFRSMRNEEVLPNEFTLDCVIRACGRLGVMTEGKSVHGLVIKWGFEFEHSIGGALIDFYCGCEAIDCAKRVYYGIGNPSLNASNTLMAGLISMERIQEAKMIFDTLKEKDPVSCNLMIKGYAMTGLVGESKRLFERMTQKTIISSNTMISVYSRNGEIDKALDLFEETKGKRDPVTWNSMMSGYVQNYEHEEAFKLYLAMRKLSVDCTRSTFSALFHASSCLGSLRLGQSLHSHLIKTPFESNVYVGTSLIDMYSKCGSIKDAQKSFICISSPNVAAWTALINAYAHHGLGYKALLHFEHMLKLGVIPNAATFVAVLCACRYAGLTTEGMRFFHSMRKDYGVNPNLEHYACVVDLLGRSGRLQEASKFIEEMPIEADAVIWGALLNACWFWMDMKLGERVAEKMFSLEPKPLFAYITLSNIYAVLGKWGEKMKVRKRQKSLEAKKGPGCSWIELNSRVHVFSVEDKTHPRCNVIYATLEHLTANINSIVQFDCVSIPTLSSGSVNASYSY